MTTTIKNWIERLDANPHTRLILDCNGQTLPSRYAHVTVAEMAEIGATLRALATEFWTLENTSNGDRLIAEIAGYSADLAFSIGQNADLFPEMTMAQYESRFGFAGVLETPRAELIARLAESVSDDVATAYAHTMGEV